MKKNTLRDDPRISPLLVAHLAKTGSDVPGPALPLPATAPRESILQVMGGIEHHMKSLLNAEVDGLAPLNNVSTSMTTIIGVDGNEIKLYVHKPTTSGANSSTTAASMLLPCVYHIHGGGMCILTADDAYYDRWRREICALGAVVIGVEFRNSAGAMGAHPFPAGLNDCMSGLQWVHDNKTALGVSHIVLNGESGGGNLVLALTLLAKQHNVLHYISGVYAQCPFISNLYGVAAAAADVEGTEKAGEEEAVRQLLPSLYECNAYILDGDFMHLMTGLYTPHTTRASSKSGGDSEPVGGADQKKEKEEKKDDREMVVRNNNPLAWPYHAKTEDMFGFPPHAITVNELDPLRDEGIAYYRKLSAAGVSVSCKTIMGTTHAAEMAPVRSILPQIHHSAIHDIFQFAVFVAKTTVTK